METRIIKNLNDTKEFINILLEKPEELLPFLSTKSIETINDIFEEISLPSEDTEAQDGQYSDKVAKCFRKDKDLLYLWKRLLIDSIHFLRMNDSREKMFLKKISDGKTPNNKTTMGDSKAGVAASDNAYGIKELNEYFKEFKNFESLLYGSEQYYRDHVLHPIKVWITGLHILKENIASFTFRTSKYATIVEKDVVDPTWSQFNDFLIEKEYKPEELVNQHPPLKISSAEVMAMWTITALTHDLGYPLEKVEKINSKLERMLSQFGNIGFSRSKFSFQAQHDHLVRFLLTMISSVIYPREDESKNQMNAHKKWKNHLRPKYLTKFSKSWEMFDHGIVSSLILLRSLTFFIESDLSTDEFPSMKTEDARQFIIRSEILHAIAAHTTPKVYHLYAHTLPFLLVLCDDLQEWGRPTFSDISKGQHFGSFVKEIKLNKCVINEKECDIYCYTKYKKLDTFEIQTDHARVICQNWHERLRPALDDTKRKMKFKWEIDFDDDNKSFWLTLNPSAEAFEEIEFKGPRNEGDSTRDLLDLYED